MEVLGGLIVRLNGWQCISELFATVELPDFREVNFRKPVLQLRVLFIGDHPVSQLAFGGDMVSTLESACKLRQVPPGIRCHSVRFTYSPDFLSFQDACVASDRTVYSFPLFVLFTSASFPKNPISLTVLSYIEKSPLMP